MAVGSISGINVKIGADLSDLKRELNTVGDTVETGLSPAKSAADDLSESFKDTAKNTKDSSINIQAIATALGTIGKALAETAWDSIKEAIKVNPETAQPYTELSTAFNDLKIALGEGLLAQLSSVAEPVTNLLKSITQFAKDNPGTAALILGIVGGIGLLGSAAGTVLPILTYFNISLAPISGTAVLVAGSIAGLVVVLGLLGQAMGDMGAKAAETSEHIATIDDTVESATFNNLSMNWEFEDHVYIPVEFVDETTGETVTKDARWDETQWNAATGAQGVWITKEEDLANAAAAATESLETQNTALDGTAESMSNVGAAAESTNLGETLAEPVEETKSTAEQAMEVMQQLQQTAESTASNVEAVDEVKMEEVNDILQSAEFQQFTSIPLDPTVAESWNTFGDSVGTAADSFSDLTGELDKNSISGQLSDIGSAADTATVPVSNLAGAVGALAEAIKELNKAGPIKLPKLGSGGGNGGSTDLFKASGGPVRAGSPYIVGEAGPELFVPRYNGNIIPNDEISARPAINVNIGNVYGESYLKDYVVRLMTGQIRKELRLAS